MKKTHPRNERTLVILKPDSVQRGLIGEIIHRYEQVGLKINAIKMMQATPEMIHKHYMLDPLWMKKTGDKAIQAYIDKGLKPPTTDPIKQSTFILSKLKRYYTSDPIVLLILEGAHAVSVTRKITGGTEPLMASIGTIRGDYGLDSYKMADDDNRSIRNLVHASGSTEEAENEISLWFKKDEIQNYTLVQEKILYDVNLDGKPE